MSFSAGKALRAGGVIRTMRCEVVFALMRGECSERVFAERMIGDQNVPAPFRHEGRGGIGVRHDRDLGIPLHEAARDQRRLDRDRGHDQDVLAGEIGRGRRLGDAFVGGGKRDGELEQCAEAGRALDADCSAHALDNAARDRKAKSGAADIGRGTRFALLEFQEDFRLLFGRDADAGVAHLEGDLARPDARLDHDGESALVGELDRVAREIEQHLAQPCGIAGDAGGNARRR